MINDGRTSHLIYLPDFNGGGAERAVLETVRAWPHDPAGVAIVVRSDSGALVQEFRNLGVRIYEIGESRTGTTRAWLASTLRLRRLICDLRPHSFVAYLSVVSPVLASLSLRRARPITCVSVQNPPSVERSEHGLRSASRTVVVRWCLRRAALVMPVSPGILDELVQLGLRRDRVVLLPNPVDVSRFPARSQRPHNESYVVGVACRLSPQKRVDVALRAFAAAARPPWSMRVFGEGDLESALRQLADELRISHQVKFYGFVADLPTQLQHLDVLLLTSDYEGFGNVIVEALAAGLPVVSTDAPYGPRYILTSDDLGTLVPVGDSEAVAAALIERSALPWNRAHVSRRQAAAAQFNPTRIAKQFCELTAPSSNGSRL